MNEGGVGGGVYGDGVSGDDGVNEGGVWGYGDGVSVTMV